MPRSRLRSRLAGGCLLTLAAVLSNCAPSAGTKGQSATGGSSPPSDAGREMGGASAAGGATGATGGAVGTGGADNASGGATASGGRATGGVMSTGGAASTGGASPGGRGSGGSGLGGATSTSPDAGTSSGGASGGGPAGGSGGAGCPGLFCEDFETGAVDLNVWDVERNGGQPSPIVVSGAGVVAHGKYAVHFHANPNVKSYDLIITKNPPVALKAHHFGRAYFMITPMPPANHTEYIFSGTTGFPAYKYLEVSSAGNNAWQLTYVDLQSTNTGEDYHAGGEVPLKTWFCLEWEFNDVPDSATIFVDGKANYTSTFLYNGAITGLVGGFSAFGFGYYAWHPATYAFDVYYDDIVLDTKRIGCL